MPGAQALSRALDGGEHDAVISAQLPVFLPPATGDVAGQMRRFLLESGLPEASLTVQVCGARARLRLRPSPRANAPRRSHPTGDDHRSRLGVT